MQEKNMIGVIDFETTGLSPDMGDRATEVAVVIIDNGKIVDQYQSLMNGGVRVPAFIQTLTGISNEMILSAPSSTQIMRDLFAFIGDIPLIAHNASFDKKFFDLEMGLAGLKSKQDFICSMRVARRIYPGSVNHKLGTLVEYANLPVAGRAHRALADSIMTAHLWLSMEAYIRRKFNMKEIPLKMMKKIQSIRCDSLEAYVPKFKQQALRSLYPSNV